MIPFKGRNGLKQYMKDKPTKWGIKVWKLVVSVMAYFLHFNVYTAETGNPGTDLGERVALDLCSSLPRGIPWGLYFDNLTQVCLWQVHYLSEVFSVLAQPDSTR